MDDERASESGQFSSAGIGYHHHAQLSRRGGVAFHHGGAVREGEAPWAAVKLGCHALNCNVGNGAGSRRRAGDHFSTADAFEVTMPSLVGCEPINVVCLLEVGWFGRSHFDVERTFGMNHVHLLLGCDTQHEIQTHRRCHYEAHSHVTPEIQLAEFLIRARSYPLRTHDSQRLPTLHNQTTVDSEADLLRRASP